MNKSYLYDDKLTKEQKYLFSEMYALINRMIDSYIIEGYSEQDAERLTYEGIMATIDRDTSGKY